MKIKWIWGVLLLLFDLEIFMWGEVKWTFLKNYSLIFLWNLVKIILMQVTLCIQKEFWIESKLNAFFSFFWVLLLHLYLKIFIGEVK